MNKHLVEKIHRLNYLCTELNAVYHQAALKLDMPDSVMCVLYAIHDNGENCLLSVVYKQSGVSKQTVNSAIRKLEKDGIVYLEPYKGKLKMIRLTDKGKKYVSDTIDRICQAEISALEMWSTNEIDMYIFLMEKYISTFNEQVEKL